MHPDPFFGRFVMRRRQSNGDVLQSRIGGGSARPGFRSTVPPPSLNDQLESLFDEVWKAERRERRLTITHAICREVRL